MHLYTIPRTPFFLTFLGLIYILFALFFAKQEASASALLFALGPTMGCALIGLTGATIPVLFSDKARARRELKVDDSGISIRIAEQATLIAWDQIRKLTQIAGYVFIKLENGSYVMIPEHACPETLVHAFLTHTKKPA